VTGPSDERFWRCYFFDSVRHRRRERSEEDGDQPHDGEVKAPPVCVVACRVPLRCLNYTAAQIAVEIVEGELPVLVGHVGVLEEYREVIPTGGGVVVGVVGPSAGGFDRSFEVNTLQRDFRHICVEISSMNGRYWAQAEYDASNGKTRFDLPTKYGSQLRAFSSDEIAISATASECTHPTNTYFVAYWPPRAQGAKATVLLNVQSGTRATILYRGKRGQFSQFM
jgi:hypothetical protein